MSPSWRCLPTQQLVLAMIVAVLSERSARAQGKGFAVDRFDAAPAGSDWFALDSLDMRGSLRPALQLLGDFAYRPLVLYQANGSVNTAVVAGQLFADLGGSLVLADRFRLALDLPVAAFQSGNSVTLDAVTYDGPNSPALGDLRLDADVRLAGKYGDAFTLAGGSQVFLPTGNQRLYAGDGAVRIAPHALAAGQLGVFTYAASLGITYHANGASYGGVPVGTELLGAASAGLLLADKHLLIGPEVWGRTDLTDGTAFKKASSPVEGTFGIHGLTAGGFRFGAGLGTGFAQGLGTPGFRALASLSYSPPPVAREATASDRDRDGVVDSADACPDAAGVRSDDPRTDGCPESPSPERASAPQAPSPPDRDLDGVFDAEDACPDAPGEPSGDPRRNGCPKAIVSRDTIRILDQVKFGFASADILPESYGLLDDVRKAIAEHPRIERVDVEGHTDNRGDEALNRALSEARARAVMTWLVQRGIDSSRLTSHGLGATKPIDTNSTEEGRRNNRRVEFHILSMAKGDDNESQAEPRRVPRSPPIPLPVEERLPPGAPLEHRVASAEEHEVRRKSERARLTFDANASALGVVDSNMFDKGSGTVQAAGFDVTAGVSLGLPVTTHLSWVSGAGLGTNYRDGIGGPVSSADAMRVDANVKTGLEALILGKASLAGRKVKGATYPSLRLYVEAKYSFWANPLTTLPATQADESEDALEPDDDTGGEESGESGGGESALRKHPLQFAQIDAQTGTDASSGDAGEADGASGDPDEPDQDGEASASSGAGPQTFSNPNAHHKVTGLTRLTLDASKRLSFLTEATFGRDFVVLDDSVEVSPNYNELAATETVKLDVVPRKLSASLGYVFERRMFDDLSASGASQDFYIQGAKLGFDAPIRRLKLRFGYDIRAKLADAGSSKNTTRNQWQVVGELPLVKRLSAVAEGRFTYTLFGSAPSSPRLLTLIGLKVKL